MTIKQPEECDALLSCLALHMPLHNLLHHLSHIYLDMSLVPENRLNVDCLKASQILREMSWKRCMLALMKAPKRTPVDRATLKAQRKKWFSGTLDFTGERGEKA